jgi:glycerol-3-phosphate dehydrogenase
LPGGDFPVHDFEAGSFSRLQQDYPFLNPNQARRYLRQYGTRARVLLGEANAIEDFGSGLRIWPLRCGSGLPDLHEWAMEAADVIWRRTKRGLRLEKPQVEALEAYMKATPRSLNHDR